MRWWPTLLLIAAFFLCVPDFKEPEYIDLNEGCMIYSLHHKMVMEANKMLEPYLWSRILAIHFPNHIGHAVNVFIYKNITFVYDPNIGTFPLYERPIYDPLQLAEILYPRIPIIKAYFIEPTLLLQYQSNSFRMY